MLWKYQIELLFFTVKEVLIHSLENGMLIINFIEWAYLNLILKIVIWGDFYSLGALFSTLYLDFRKDFIMNNKILDKIWKDILDKDLGDFNREIKNCNINVDDNEFTIRPTDSSRFFAKFNRENFSCLELRTDSKHSLEEITNFCNKVALVLQNYKLELDKIFGVEMKSIDDFKRYCKFLIDAGIEKEYVIGMTKKRSYGDYYDKFGVIFDPNGYFSIEFTDRDKELYEKIE